MTRLSAPPGSATALCAMLLAGAGCDLLLGEEVDGLRQVSASDRSDNSGTATFDVRVDENETSMLLSATVPGDNLTVFYELYTPGGDRVLHAESLWTEIRSKTGAVFPAPTASLNWPVESTDAPLEPGVWEVVVRTTDAAYYYTPNVDIQLDQLFKVDTQTQSGVLDVNIIYAGGTDQDEELVAATEEAQVIWTELYDRIGITPRFRTDTYSNGKLPPPGEGSAEDYIAIAGQTPLRSVNVVILPYIDGYQGQGLYGIAGGIPGPLVETGLSAVAVDALTNSGPDLLFSDEELRIYAETLAHEVGHFIGLFHPVEADYSFYDAVDDTEECSSKSTCENALGNNLMFPYPVCSFAGCELQDQLTDGQARIAHRYVGVE